MIRDEYGRFREWVELCLLLLAFVGIIVFLLLLIGIPLIAGERLSCIRQAEASSFEVRWGLFEGCLVRTEQGWRPFNFALFQSLGK